MKKNVTKVLSTLVAMAAIVSFSACSSATPAAKKAPTEQKSAAESKAPVVAAAPATMAVDHDLGSGIYTSGIDFPAGKYDITAVSGGGNVTSSNAFSGGINAIMGTAEKNKETGIDMYEQEYSNIDLPDGTTLSLSGVTVKIASDKASGDPLKTRNQAITETVDIGNGNFVSGEDFPAGVYNVVTVSGGGNVTSDNLMNGGINAIMGTADQNGAMGLSMYEQEYKNIEFPEGATLTVDGVKIQLIPSK